jgi:hypothetical protein
LEIGASTLPETPNRYIARIASQMKLPRRFALTGGTGVDEISQ